jgi:N-glycosylase/DNA lyase
MQKLIARINAVKKTAVKKLIDQRMKEFRSFTAKPNKAWFCELCFCLMTANWKAAESIKIQEELSESGFCTWDVKKLAAYLKEKGHRFWPQRADRIVMARRFKDIKDIVKSQKDPREWLAENIYGLGYKESSHFLRNVGYTDYAIIDRHILHILAEEGLIKEQKTLTKRKYLEIEAVLKKLGEMVHLNQAELDMYLWYLRTGKVLK